MAEDKNSNSEKSSPKGETSEQPATKPAPPGKTFGQRGVEKKG